MSAEDDSAVVGIVWSWEALEKCRRIWFPRRGRDTVLSRLAAFDSCRKDSKGHLRPAKITVIIKGEQSFAFLREQWYLHFLLSSKEPPVAVRERTWWRRMVALFVIVGTVPGATGQEAFIYLRWPPFASAMANQNNRPHDFKCHTGEAPADINKGKLWWRGIWWVQAFSTKRIVLSLWQLL